MPKTRARFRAIISYYVNLCYSFARFTGLSKQARKVGQSRPKYSTWFEDLAMQGHATWGANWPSVLRPAPTHLVKDGSVVCVTDTVFNVFRNTQGRILE